MKDNSQYQTTMKGKRVDWKETCSQCFYGLSEQQTKMGNCKNYEPNFIIFNGKYCLSFKEKE